MITYNIVGKNISGSVNGKPFSTPYTVELWGKMEAAAKAFAAASTMEEAKESVAHFEGLAAHKKSSTIKSITPNVIFDESKNAYFFKHGDKTSSVALPQILVDKLIFAHDNNLPVDPIIKLVARAHRNPNVTNAASAERFLKELCDYVFQTFVDRDLQKELMEKEGYSESVAAEMATLPQTPITMEGLICTKKVVTPLMDAARFKFIQDEEGNPKKVLRDGITKTVDEETGAVTISEPEFAEDWVFQPLIMGNRGDAFRCGNDKDSPLGHVIRVGQEIRLDSWDQVNTDPNRSCVKGLHSGNHDYIRSFERPDNVTLEVFVDPANIGAIPYHDVAGVCRSIAQFVHGVKSRKIPNRNLYHSSTYAAMTDARWEEVKAEAANRFAEEAKAAAEALAKKQEALSW